MTRLTLFQIRPGILLGMLVLCTIPAHGQIVSYLDSSGKRVFINADPTPAARQAKSLDSRAGLCRQE